MQPYLPCSDKVHHYVSKIETGSSNISVKASRAFVISPQFDDPQSTWMTTKKILDLDFVSNTIINTRFGMRFIMP